MIGVRLQHFSIIAVILCIILTGCTVTPDSYWVHYNYRLNVYSENQSLQYRILLPVPINDSNETHPEFLENIENIQGVFTVEINQTINGPSLAIYGNGDIGLEIDFDRESDNPIEIYFNLSMLDDYRQNEDFGFFWMYADAENISIQLTYYHD